MHELSVALAIVEMAAEEAARRGAARIAVVHLKAGPLSGIDADALRFSFEHAAAGTAVDGAQLAIEVPAVTAWCDGCRAERAVISPRSRRCAECGCAAPRLIQGAELEVVALEIIQ